MALIARQDIDLAVIASPNDTHAPLALAALEAGKHVLVDKPFTVTVAEADAVAATARRANRIAAVYQNRRWDADFLTLRNVLESGTLGEIVTFESRIDRYRPGVPDRWRDRPGPGAGLLYDLAPHLMDQALVLFGWPDWIEAEAMTQRKDASVVDAFFLRLGKGRLRMHLSAGALFADSGLRFGVHGTRGSFVKTGIDVQEDKLRAGASPRAPGFGAEPEVNWPMVTTIEHGKPTARRVATEPGRYLSFYEGLRKAIEGGGPVPVTAEEGRRVMLLIELALEANRTHGRVACGSDT
ncbi:MAG: Gfo/Idh/MocA family oxidoreductase [Dongiaceae bacterium]